MAKRNRSTQAKREREQQKRERQRRKAAKAAAKRERRFGKSTAADAGLSAPPLQEPNTMVETAVESAAP